MRTNLVEEDVSPKLRNLISEIFNTVPCGVGVGGIVKLSEDDYNAIISKGVKWAIDKGFGMSEDLERIEDYGFFPGGDHEAVSD